MKLVLATVFAALASPALAQPIDVVTSFSILGDMVEQVGGDRVAVTTIVDANADTHVYEPKPADAAALARAQIFVVNGLGFEGWLERLVEATGYEGLVITASEGVQLHDMDEDGEMVTDPHAWQSLKNGILYVQNIAKGLCAVDAEGCPSYETNAATYEAALGALDAEVKSQIAEIPEDKRKVITTHDAFGYFGEAYGVTFLAPEGISTDSEPSAAEVAGLIQQIRAEGVTALFIENMTDSRLIEQIARETGIEVGGELYADALSGPDGPAVSYLDLFRHNVGLLIPAMKGE